MTLMLINPTYYLNSALNGLKLFSSSVLPTLFPFYFCSLLLTYIGAVKGVSRLGKKPMRILFNTPKESAYVLLMSMLCGYPVGASTTFELYEQGLLNTDDVKTISAFASTSGPVFILGTVGGAIFNDTRVGAIILISHYFGAIINGLIYTKRKNKTQSNEISTIKDIAFTRNKIDNILSNAISKSTMNMLCVGGYIVICGMIIDTLSIIELPNLIASIMDSELSNTILSIIYGTIEMTRGIIACKNLADIHLSRALTSAIISFGGLSITLQNYTFLSKCKMTLPKILIRKITQCIISAIISYLLSFML